MRASTESGHVRAENIKNGHYSGFFFERDPAPQVARPVGGTTAESRPPLATPSPRSPGEANRPTRRVVPASHIAGCRRRPRPASLNRPPTTPRGEHVNELASRRLTAVPLGATAAVEYAYPTPRVVPNTSPPARTRPPPAATPVPTNQTPAHGAEFYTEAPSTATLGPKPATPRCSTSR